MTAIKLQPSKYSMIPFVRDSVISVVLNAVDRPCCLFIQKVLCTASNHETVRWHRRGGFIYQPISDHTLPFVCLSWPTKSTIHLYVSLPACLPVDLSVYLATCLCNYFLTCLFVCLSVCSDLHDSRTSKASGKKKTRQAPALPCLSAHFTLWRPVLRAHNPSLWEQTVQGGLAELSLIQGGWGTCMVSGPSLILILPGSGPIQKLP